MHMAGRVHKYAHDQWKANLNLKSYANANHNPKANIYISVYTWPITIIQLYCWKIDHYCIWTLRV